MLIINPLSLQPVLAHIMETNIPLAIPFITQQMDMVTASQQCVGIMVPLTRTHTHAQYQQHLPPLQPLLQPASLQLHLFLQQHQVCTKLFWNLKIVRFTT